MVTWPVEKLIPYARNARTHSDEQVAQIAASIAEFGWTNPILAGADGIVIAGHARLLAARKLGMTEVPVIVLDHLTESQRRALVLADNRLALNAGWDEEMLRVELVALDEEGFNLDVVGFTEDEIEDLLRDPEEVHAGNTDDDAVPETPETAVTVPGDVWILGRAPTAVRRCHADGRRGEGPGRRPGRHGVHGSAVQRELRRDDEGQTPRQEAEDRQRQPRRRSSSSSCGTPA